MYSLINDYDKYYMYRVKEKQSAMRQLKWVAMRTWAQGAALQTARQQTRLAQSTKPVAGSRKTYHNLSKWRTEC